MRILTWNIQHGGGARVDAIVEKIFAVNPDIVVITEFRNNPSGARIIAEFSDAGYGYIAHHDTPPRINSVLLASRIPFEEKPMLDLVTERHRCVSACFDSFTIFGLYFAIGKEKLPLFNAIVNIDSKIIAEPSILIGDFNTGRHFIDESGATFICADFFDKFEEVGFIDAWRTRNPEQREFTWFSNAGNGFRLDHTFASESFNQNISKIEYSHSERIEKVSDHSLMILEVDSFR